MRNKSKLTVESAVVRVSSSSALNSSWYCSETRQKGFCNDKHQQEDSLGLPEKTIWGLYRMEEVGLGSSLLLSLLPGPPGTTAPAADVTHVRKHHCFYYKILWITFFQVSYMTRVDEYYLVLAEM